MKVLLTTINSKYIHQNLAIRLLYELNKNHTGLAWKEFFIKENLEGIAAYCSNYQIVAFSCYIWNISRILDVAKKIKSINPKCKIMLGGPEVSYEWTEIIELDEIDYVIAGEGEIPFSEFLNSYPDIENVSGLIMKKNGILIENQPTTTFELGDFDNLNPYKNDPKEELKNKICYIESSRGCPHTCEFCLAGLDNKLRFLPTAAIQSNLLYLMENGRIVKFLDRTFNANLKFAISIFKFILENYRKGNIFQFEIKADIPQAELIEFIKTYVPKGIFRFEIGIQTLNTKSNDSIKRKQNFENIRSFIDQISDKIEIHLDLIVGLPHDYYSDIKYSLEEVFKLYAPELQLGFLKFLKGTPTRNNYKMHDYQFDAMPPYQIVESKYLTKEEIRKIEIVEQALEIYWNKKRTLHTLKFIASNYSIFDFLLGLGEHFITKNGIQHYGLNEIYTTIYEFSCLNYHENKVIPQLIALDYYLQFKVKPKTQFVDEIEKSIKYKVLEKLHLNYNKLRYIVLPFNFKLEKYLNEKIIEFTNELIVIQYDGINKPQIVFVPSNSQTLNFIYKES